MAAKFCQECGAPLPPGAKFCASCGAKIVQVEAPAQPPKDGQTTYIPVQSIQLPPQHPQGSYVPPQGQAPQGDRAPGAQLTGWRSVVASIASAYSFLPGMGWVARNCDILDGRLNRAPFLKNSILLYLLSALYGIIAGLIAGVGDAIDQTLGDLLYVVLLIAVVVPFVAPSILLSRARLHDLDKSGWLMLLGLIPIVNFFYIIYVLCFAGTHGPNQYGEDPLAQRW